MSLSIKTLNPSILLSAIKKEIDEKKIETWEYDKDGDFFHNPPQWKGKAWLRPSETQGSLNFKLIWPENSDKDKYVSGIYHGRFIEMMCNHFKTQFSTINADLP